MGRAVRKSSADYLLNISLNGNRSEVQNLVYEDRQNRQRPRSGAELPILH